MSFFVYFIEATNGRTYIGATVDLNKRIRQHNCEIKGGAMATSREVNKGESWKYICYIENCPSWNAALQCEWRWKYISRQIQKTNPNQTPKEKRLEALDKLLKLDKPTSKAELYSSWPNFPNVIYIH
jgi:predicted GIY-YIG superfamily endonuclease|tara:strand:- start:3418 stop:3798 length:381 start_codon:yes stop_codon:yes gene_type:complete